MVTTIVNLALPVDDPSRIIEIQGYQAENYAETPSQPNFDSIDIGGRSSPITYYNGGQARTISFSMLFHRDMVAPWTSAVSYGGQPGGIEASGSQYAGLYLGTDSSQGLTTSELKEKYIQDYLRYYNEYLGGAKINGKRYNLFQPTKNQRVAHIGGIDVITEYDDNGKLIGTSRANPTVTKRYSSEWAKSNAEGEADATARFHLFMNKIKALNYPVYTPSGIIPPKIYLKIGGDEGSTMGGLRLKGYCTTNINYDGIVKHNSLISASVDFTFTEVVDIAWSAPEVIDNMQRYITWMDAGLR